MNTCYSVVVTKDARGYHFTVVGLDGKPLAANPVTYSDANEAFTHGHNAERLLWERGRK